MSIFGIKKERADSPGLEKEISDLRRQLFSQVNIWNEKRNNMSDQSLKIRHLESDISHLKQRIQSFITICAETKGALTYGKIFSFGNGGKEDDVGYVMIRRGYITGIGLSSKRTDGEVKVGVKVNGEILNGCEITLNTTPRKHDNFGKPFLVEAGSVINFVCLNTNRNTDNTVASLLIEFL